MIRLRLHDGTLREIAPEPGRTLAQAIFLAGLWDGVPLCAGLGKCGLCRVRLTGVAPAPKAEEIKRLGVDAVAQGWRLGCLHPSEGLDLTGVIELPEPRRTPARLKTGTRVQGPVDLAVDLGTTSIHWAAWSGKAIAASGQALNPQMGLGSEVMSRLAYARTPGGAEVLRGLALARLRGIVRQAGRVERMCIAGNSAMTCLLLGLPVEGLARAPYRLDYAGGDEREIAPDLPPALIPPLLAPFVGADLSAGLAALRFSPHGPPDYPFLLADLGTNGEFVLALSESEYLLASVPMGPALEGVGLRHGGVAAPGSVRAFGLTPAGLAPHYVERPPLEGEAPGITGVGYLSLAAALLRAGALDESGRFVVPATPLGKKLAGGLRDSEGERVLPLPGGMDLPASDVEELVKVKAAFNLALSRLLAESGLKAADLAAVHLAGAMGEHVDARDLADLGFLPPALAGRVRRAGNTSLAGAGLLLANAAAWDWTLALPGKCRALDLASDPRFGGLYVERMVLSHVS
jgi:uncharacterized 2Fe-2S/4Fe-4S cluster protein (DUF4445 family)/ferredoxin